MSNSDATVSESSRATVFTHESEGRADSDSLTVAPAGSDLDAIDSLDDLVEELRLVHARSGRSYRDLEKWGARNNKPLPRATVSDFLTGRRRSLPRKSMLLNLLEACGVSPAEAPAWERAWARLATKEFRGDKGKGEAVEVAAEQSVLGSMLLSERAITDALEVLTVHDFSMSKHAMIFKAIIDQHRRGGLVDPVTVAGVLAHSGELDQAGGAPYLKELVEAGPAPDKAEHYARILADRARLRQLKEMGQRVAQLASTAAEDGETSVDVVVDLAERALRELTEGWTAAAKEKATVLGDLLMPVLDEIESIGSTDNKRVVGVPTGFVDLDRLLNGLRPGQLIAVAGDVSVGKSILAMDFVRNAAVRHNLASAVFTAEISKTEVVMRLLAAEARVPLHVLHSGQLSDDDWTKLARRMSEIANAPVFVDDTVNVGDWEIWQQSLRLRQEHDLKLVVVDCPLIMNRSNVHETLQDLKLLAQRLDCPVVVVSQLQVPRRKGSLRPPDLTDVNESLAQIADVVILVHREDLYDKETPRAGEADLVIAKHRNGPTDTVTVAAQVHLSRFVDIAVGPIQPGRRPTA